MACRSSVRRGAGTALSRNGLGRDSSRETSVVPHTCNRARGMTTSGERGRPGFCRFSQVAGAQKMHGVAQVPCPLRTPRKHVIGLRRVQLEPELEQGLGSSSCPTTRCRWFGAAPNKNATSSGVTARAKVIQAGIRGNVSRSLVRSGRAIATAPTSARRFSPENTQKTAPPYRAPLRPIIVCQIHRCAWLFPVSM